MDDHISRIEAALEAGPTSGEWDADFASAMRNGAPAVVEYFVRRDGEDISIAADIVDPETGLPSQANADYIAAVNPATIRALLDRLKAAEAENERMREFERSAALTLPGVYYVDPPDGGDVSLLKQLQRMSIDAARYRLLRRKFAIISDGNGNAEFCPINFPRPTYIAPNTAIELDTALDRERLGMEGAERPPTPVGWSDTDRAADYLRACADALENGPVAWTDGYGSAVTRTELKGREPHEFTADPDMLAYRIPLYPVAMPALRLPEPMTDGDLLRLFSSIDQQTQRLPTGWKLLSRAIEAETLRRVKEANK